MQLDDFRFELPEDLIAQYPAESRTASRLLAVDRDNISDDLFINFINYPRKNDILVFNNTKVMPARLAGVKPGGGKVEILIERILSDHLCLALVKTNKKLSLSGMIFLSDGSKAVVKGRRDDFFVLEFKDKTVNETMQSMGRIPLPPYIKRPDENLDAVRYQTVYAKNSGAAAAPTAGLHFDENMLTQLKTRFAVTEITLHVGAGTFQPVRTHDISRHKMHSEVYEITTEAAKKINLVRSSGGRVIAIGTTTLRALEATAQTYGRVTACKEETGIFITPGFKFKVVDMLVTNFHLPRSTLLMLVSAFGGPDVIKKAYRHAVAENYRFFSYGDAMLLAGDNRRESG